MSFFVYIHTCPNGKKYVGVTTQKNIKCRWRKGEGYKGQHFYRAIQKYGWDNIEHKYFKTESKELMFYWEKILIYYHNSTNKKFGYNKTGGGDSCFEISDDTRLKQKVIRTGKKHSEETKKKISAGNKGKKFSEEAKKKMSEARKGKKYSPRSEETKKKMSEARKGKKYKPCSDESRKRYSEARKLYWENKRKNNT